MNNEQPNEVKKPQEEKTISVVFDFLKSILSLNEGLDRKGAIESIKKDVSFRGHSIWILICSIFIASLGLNTNSTAVVIGAMLISPLMSPILGVGLAIGINDFELLKRSLKNIAIMVVVSLLTSVVFFVITPLSAADSEILNRTKPTILDALIAIFGGLAGIIGNTRKEKTNVIPGVAIATALMPPLCTAGYGIANQRFDYFLGAFYLFFLNAVLISLATFIIIRVLNFNRFHHVDKARERKLNIYMGIIVGLVLIPSAYIFMEVVQESYFNGRTQQFINENFAKGSIINKNIEYDREKGSHIELFVVGKVPERTKMQKKLKDYNINNTRLSITELGSADIQDIFNEKSQNNEKMLQDMYQKSEAEIKLRENDIDSLEYQIKRQRIINDPLELRQEIFALYDDLATFSLTNSVEVKKDGDYIIIPVATIHWSKKKYLNQMIKDEKVIEEWIKARYKLDTLKMVRY